MWTIIALIIAAVIVMVGLFFWGTVMVVQEDQGDQARSD